MRKVGQKPLMAVILALLLGACSPPYSVAGQWEGYVENRSYPYDQLSLRFNLRETPQGVLSGSHYAYLSGSWTYLGEIDGQRSGNNAYMRVSAPNGYISVTGTFDGDEFSGTYYIVAYSSGSATGDVFLTRTSYHVTQVSGTGIDAGSQLAKLIEQLR